MYFNAFNKTNGLLITSIVISIFFLTMMIFDYVDLETTTIATVRALLLLPFFLILLCLPIIIFYELRKQKDRKSKRLISAGIISIAMLIIIFIMTFS